MTTTPLTAARIREVRLANDDLFWRYPNVVAVGEGYFKSPTGDWMNIIGIIVHVSERVSPTSIPAADRITDIIDGVPVQIRVDDGEYGHMMGEVNEEHRPLKSGILVTSVRRVVDEDDTDVTGATVSFVPVDAPGTLTGVATSTFDNTRVVMTAAHVMAPDGSLNPTGDEEMYQETIDKDLLPIRSLPEFVAGYTPTETKKIGTNVNWSTRSLEATNVADLAICDLVDNMPSQFMLHGDPHLPGRMIVPGVVEPFCDPANPDNCMKLTMIGARNGEGTVKVREVNQIRTVDGVRYMGLVQLDAKDRAVQGGDSGGACFVKVGDNKYKMCCIVTIADKGRGHEAYAFPASLAQRYFSIKFGHEPPVANAGDAQDVLKGTPVTLTGAVIYGDGDSHTYEWTQVDLHDKVTLERANTLSPGFTAPNRSPITLKFRLTVTDNYWAYDYDEVEIKVGPDVPGPAPTPRPPGNAAPPVTTTPPANRLPVANAGIDQTVATHVVVTLDGSGSRDPDTGDTLTYAWKQVQQGSEPWITTLLNTTSAVTTFISPTGPASLTLHLTVTDNHGATGTDTVSITVFAPPTPWTDTGNIRGSGASREKEQTRTGPLGQTETQWVSDPEPVIWSRWSRTGSTRGCGPTNAYEESRTSNYGDTNTRWISDPEAETWGNWTNTGRFMGSCDSREAQQTRTSNCNNTQTQWVVDPEPIIWGPWTRTGLTRGRCSNREAQESSVSNCAGTQTRWFSDPEPETWDSWTDTGRTQIIDAFTSFKEQQRISSCDNTETRWV